jgi:crotonobetainyl-CoA:carnitine CoA-transferase CaiB-like acyl-CoA transferase
MSVKDQSGEDPVDTVAGVDDPTEATRGERPLVGLRVLDFSHAAAGPFLTMYLADLGAEVIKIEKPGRGDGARHMSVPILGPLESEYHLALNRNKKDVLIDLQQPAGVEAARRLAAQSDVVVQNFRPGVMDRLGLGFSDLAAVRPNLVYCSISAFGPTGPWGGRPANDIIVQSISGLMGITGEPDGGPVRIGAPITDFSTGLFGLSAVLAALFGRDKYPEGQHVEVSMLDSAIAIAGNYVPSLVVGLRKSIPRVGRAHASIVPYQAFRCSDDEYVMVGAFTNSFWQRLCEAVGRPEWIDDPRFLVNADRLKNRSILVPELEALFAQKSREEWIEILGRYDIPCSPVLELQDALVSEQAVHNRVVQRIDTPLGEIGVVKSPIESQQWEACRYDPAAPMGLDTDEVLEQVAGYSPDELDALAEDVVIARGSWEEAGPSRIPQKSSSEVHG